MTSNILVADQGTTSTRSIVFSAAGDALAAAQQEFPQHFPALAGSSTIPRIYGARRLRRFARAMSAALASRHELAGLGLTNQRETTLLWNRRTGKPIHNAIVWQDRRTADECARLRALGRRDVGERAIWPPDRPLFLGDQDCLAPRQRRWRQRRKRSEANSRSARSIPFCSGGAPTAASTRPTRPTPRARCCSTSTRASGTRIFLRLFRVPSSLLPRSARHRRPVRRHGERASSGPRCRSWLWPATSRSALVGQACFEPGMVKATYGTCAFRPTLHPRQ